MREKLCEGFKKGRREVNDRLVKYKGSCGNDCTCDRCAMVFLLY